MLSIALVYMTLFYAYCEHADASLDAKIKLVKVVEF